MLLLATLAHAGLIDSLSDGERQIAVCQQAAAPAEEAFDFGKAAGVWEACLAEAKRSGQTDAAARIADQVAVMKARAKAAEWRTTDVDRYAQEVLSVVPELGSAQPLGTDVQDVFRAWMTTEAGKGKLEPVRTVTLIWESGKDDPTTKTATELFRRHVEDMGLKWAEPGKPEVDVVVYATLEVKRVDPVTAGPGGSLPRAAARLEADRVRFKTIDATSEGFHVATVAEEADADAATDAAVHAACERAAARLLTEVLRQVFR